MIRWDSTNCEHTNYEMIDWYKDHYVYINFSCIQCQDKGWTTLDENKVNKLIFKNWTKLEDKNEKD